MAKNRRRRKRSETRDEPLGKLIKEYRPSPATIIGLSLGALLAGIGVAVYGLLRQSHPWPFVLLGGVFVLMAPVLLVINFFNFGRALQVRQWGVRVIHKGSADEMAWDEIADIDVRRTDVANLGIATVWSRRSDVKSPGLLAARTEWEIWIRGQDGRTIHLSRAFLEHLPDVRGLVILLRKNAGLS